MPDSCFTPCLLTGFGVMLIFIIAHIFLYLKLLELSKERHDLPKESHNLPIESHNLPIESHDIPKESHVIPKKRPVTSKKRHKKA
jgi:hypothetical protein